jgi:hypothetical protein
MSSFLDFLGITPAEAMARFDAALQRGVQEALRQQLDMLPTLDYQLTIPQAASVLGLDDDTVRTYTELHASDQRKLHVVMATESARGKRVLLSQLSDWQQRNRTDPDDGETLRRKAAAARRKGRA